MADAKILELTILERDYRVNCPAGAEDQLRQAARFLDEKMNEIKQSGASAGKVLGTDRIAVIAALNIAHQLLDMQQLQEQYTDDINSLQHYIDSALEKDLQLEL